MFLLASCAWHMANSSAMLCSQTSTIWMKVQKNRANYAYTIIAQRLSDRLKWDFLQILEAFFHASQHMWSFFVRYDVQVFNIHSKTDRQSAWWLKIIKITTETKLYKHHIIHAETSQSHYPCCNRYITLTGKYIFKNHCARGKDWPTTTITGQIANSIYNRF